MLPTVLLLAGVSLLGACSPGESRNEAQEQEVRTTPVETVFVGRGDIQNTYTTITTLEAGDEAQVVARASGILEDIYVEEGDYVEKDQVLAQLDIEQLRLQLAQDEATLSLLAADLEREEAIFSRNLGAGNTLDKARFDYESQKARYELTQLQIRYATITSPISGIITERMVKQGNLISNNDALFHIVDPDSLEAVIHLPQKEFAKVQVGQRVKFRMDSFTDMSFLGEIVRIRPMIDTDTGTFRVISSVNNPQRQLQSGMFGRAELILETHENSLLLQEAALITKDNRSHVFVVREDKAVQTPVAFDIRHNGMVEIVSGLEDNDEVIVTGQQTLEDGSPVEVIEG